MADPGALVLLTLLTLLVVLVGKLIAANVLGTGFGRWSRCLDVAIVPLGLVAPVLALTQIARVIERLRL